MDQLTEFNQMMRPFALVHDPLPFVGAARAGFNAVSDRFGPLERRQSFPPIGARFDPPRYWLCPKRDSDR